MTAYVSNSGAEYLDLTLPYRVREGELFPLLPGTELELLSQALGLGVRTRGKVAGHQEEGVVRVECRDPLEAFQRRVMPRIDIPVGLRYARGQGHLRSLRAKWEKQLELLQAPQAEQPSFPYCPVNLSGGGIRFNFREAPRIAEVCLLLLELSPQTPPVCALAEVVWLRPAEKPGLQAVGMQFTHIRKADQDRICRFVTEVQKQQAQAAQTPTES
ncbi:PilZ domain-containing protein [Geoalkalibacter sp.]|uniref:PilZ domain-containing protein n=1 Tax=Geoalkalibacter sp. TaxID=3041440 RepID=UPI00272E492C|nr:PilZ domain-containing protein [Geoalkalibacter sp.]